MNALIKTAIAFVVSICLVLLLSPITIISAGERGVMTHFGAVDPIPLGEGIHWRTPLRDRIVHIDVKVQNHEVDAKGSTKDLQDLNAIFSVNFGLDPDLVPQIYQRQGSLDQIVTRIISPQTQESFKTAAAQFTAEESIVRRPELKQSFDEILSERVDKYGLKIYDTNVVDISFSKEFSDAVEAKQVAEQDSQRAVYIAEKAAKEAQGRINFAQGEAEAQKLLQVSLDDKLLRKQELDNQKEAIAKWDGHLPNVNSGVMPFLNISEETKKS